MNFQWSKEYETGVAKFDEQHKALFTLVLKLQTAMEKNEGSSATRGILEELIGYTKSHFKDEEAALEASGFSGLAAHREEHVKLTNQVGRYYSDLITGKIVFSGAILNFLLNWLTEHIAKCDKEYGPHFSKHPVRPS